MSTVELNMTPEVLEEKHKISFSIIHRVTAEFQGKKYRPFPGLRKNIGINTKLNCK